jgi:hypothetical protein
LRGHYLAIKVACICLVLNLSSQRLFSQTAFSVSGKVSSESAMAIGHANVILKNKADSTIAFTATDEQGLFSIKILIKATAFILEVRSLGFQKQVISLDAASRQQNVNVVLKPSDILLNQVNIVSKTPPIKVSNDTTTYKVSRFLTGNEVVVEDVLRKLPGIEVSDNGKITYKGKAITKVLIEDDDMFSSNYQVGTKNIKSGIINEVQAIENYNSNNKLAGLTKSNETVLNLKVKDDVKNKPNLSAAVGYGIKNAYEADVNLIGIGKKLKYFIQGSANNVGLNPSPYEYYTFQNSTPEIADIADYQQKLINTYYILPVLKPQRGYINHTKFTSGNAVFKPSKKVTVTGSYNLYTDDLDFTRQSNTQYVGLQNNLAFTESEKINKKPVLGGGFLKILLDVSKNSNLSFTTDYNAEHTRGRDSLDANYGAYNSSLLDKNYLVDERVNFTSRLSANSALTLNLKLFKADQTQNYLLLPALSVIDSALSQNVQDIHLKNTGVELKSSYLLKRGKMTQAFNLQLGQVVTDISSDLNTPNPGYQNDFHRKYSNLHLAYVNTLSVDKLKLSASIGYELKRAEDKAALQPALTNTLTYFAPTVNIEYKLGELNKLATSISYDKALPLATDLLPSYILTDNRTLSSGLYAVNKKGTTSIVSTFIHADLFSQFIYYLNFIYLKNTGGYGYAQNINFNYSQISRIITPGTDNYLLTASFSKYLPFISSTVKYTGNVSWYKFYNQLNASPLRQNLTYNNGQKVELKSGLPGWFNFEVGGKYLFNRFKTYGPDYANSNQNVQSYLNLLVKPSKNVFVSLINEQYFTNVGANNAGSYYFMDLSVRYTAKRISYKIIGSNLLNNARYTSRTLSETSVSDQSNSLLPARLLFEVEYRF